MVDMVIGGKIVVRSTHFVMFSNILEKVGTLVGRCNIRAVATVPALRYSWWIGGFTMTQCNISTLLFEKNYLCLPSRLHG